MTTRRMAIQNLLSDPSFSPGQWIEELLIDGIDRNLGKVLSAEPKYCKYFADVQEMMGRDVEAILHFRDWEDEATFIKILRILDHYGDRNELQRFIRYCPTQYDSFIASHIGFNSRGFQRRDIELLESDAECKEVWMRFGGRFTASHYNLMVSQFESVDNVSGYQFDGSTILASRISSIDAAITLSKLNTVYTSVIIAERIPINLSYKVRAELSKFSRIKCYNNGCGFCSTPGKRSKTRAGTASGLGNHRRVCDAQTLKSGQKVIMHPADILVARAAGNYTPIFNLPLLSDP